MLIRRQEIKQKFDRLKKASSEQCRHDTSRYKSESLRSYFPFISICGAMKISTLLFRARPSLVSLLATG